MTDDLTDAIHTILTDVDEILRERLVAIGAEVAHVLVAVTADGAALVRGNVDPAGLKSLAKDLEETADEALSRPDDGEPIH